jgi:hypothetical protein
VVNVRNDGNISKIWIGGMEHFQGPAIWKLSPIVSINDTTFEINFPTEILKVDVADFLIIIAAWGP